MLSRMDLLVFMLGFTEARLDINDGTVFPVCSGYDHG